MATKRFNLRRFGRKRRGKGRPAYMHKFRRRPRKQISFGQPQQMVIKMRYTERITIDPGASGTIAGAVYRANGLFDPSVTFAGHQPQSYDSWLGADGSGALYKEFLVIGSKIRVDFMATAAENNRVGITLSDSSSVPASETIANENRATVKSMLGANTGGKPVASLYKGFSAKRWFRHATITSERDTHGTYGADPTRQAYFAVWAEGLGIDTTAIKAQITIDYVVLLREPAQLPQS